LQQRQHVGGGKESRKENREDGKKRRKNRKYDSLLTDPPDSHPTALVVYLPKMFARFDRECKQDRSAAGAAMPAGLFAERNAKDILATDQAIA
jgi:hypothetical protein